MECRALAYVLLGVTLMAASGWLLDPGPAAAAAVKAVTASEARPRQPASHDPPTGAALGGIKVYFKLDPSLTRGLYLGERWVSPPTYSTALQEGARATVEARAEGQDVRGGRLVRNLAAEWLPADPDMVTVSPGPGNVVTLTVRRAGETTLEVRSGEVSRILVIRTTYRQQENRTQVRISQGQPR